MRGSRESRLMLRLPTAAAYPNFGYMSDSGSELAFTATCLSSWDSVSKVIKLKDSDALWKMRDKRG